VTLWKAASEANSTTSGNCCTASAGISLSPRFGRCIIDDDRFFAADQIL